MRTPIRTILRATALVLATGTVAIVPAAAHAGDSPEASSGRSPTGRVDTVGGGSWSYFGDPRSIAGGGGVFTGWISQSGDVWVERFDLATQRRQRVKLFEDLGVDDHNNPSLVWRRGQLLVFFSPHSGRLLPRGDISRMRYRTALRRHDIAGGFGPVREVHTNTPGGLGFTYPNAIARGARVWLFWRGGDWRPTVSHTDDGLHWAPARTLVLGPAGQRPYAKYAPGPNGAIDMIFSDGHPQSYRNSLYFVRMRGRRFYRADGTLVGTFRSLPLRLEQLDRVYSFRKDAGRAWPHDVAESEDGHPVIVYTLRRGGPLGTDVFHRARWDGRRWVDERIVSAGQPDAAYTSGGITLDHEDTDTMYLSRRIGRYFGVEVWRWQEDLGEWSSERLSSEADGPAFRPVTPRGLRNDEVVLWISGLDTNYTDYHTLVRRWYMPRPQPSVP